MVQAANVLRREGLDLAVQFLPKKPHSKFNRWVLTKEVKVVAPKNATELSKWSGGDFKEMEGLSLHSVELVSPILQTPRLVPNFQPNGLDDIVNYVEQLAKSSSPVTPYQFISRPENAGVHVHIGLQPNPSGDQVSIPVNVLRHLAWIVVCFEDVISLLHHPERHGYAGTKISNCSVSDRTAFGSRQSEEELYHACKPLNMEKVFSEIFAPYSKVKRGLKNLKKVMYRTPYGYENRLFFVSFSNMNPKSADEKITVEFRQHHGTLDVEDLSEWIIFVTELMRTAERKANEAPTDIINGDDGKPNIELAEKAKYDHIFRLGGRRTLKELFDLMQMPTERRRFWWERAKKFRALASTSAKQYNRIATCPSCDLPPLRDCEGWGEGELYLPP